MRGYFRKAWRILNSGGAAATIYTGARQVEIFRLNREYRRWLRLNGPLTDEEKIRIKRRIEDFDQRPLISILMPVYNTSEKWLRAAIESVRRQLYGNWELCIADDNSDFGHVKRILEEYAAGDERIKVVFRTINGHISAASNSALDIASGEFTALLDHDDELAEEALYHVAAEINKYPSANLIYSDEDKIDARGGRFYPWFKPDWSPELFYSLNMLTHLCVFRTRTLRKIGGFREGFEGSQDYDLALRFIEQISPASIRHIPRILYHWRSIPGSVAFDASEKSYAADRARIALNEHLGRSDISARCEPGSFGCHRAIFDPPADKAEVSIIISVRKNPLEIAQILLEKGKMPNIEIILAGDCECRNFAGGAQIQVAKIDESGIFCVFNRAVRMASGSVLVFLDESTVAVSDNWLWELAGRASGKRIGAVAPMIVDPANRVIHAGYVFGIGGGIGRAHFGRNAAIPDAMRRLSSAQSFSAVSTACMAIGRDVFDEVGGFNDTDFPEYYGDADLCLRLLRLGYRNVWTPWARVTQAGPRILPEDREFALLRERWEPVFESDPYYNPNLTDSDEKFSLAAQPRISRI